MATPEEEHAFFEEARSILGVPEHYRYTSVLVSLRSVKGKVEYLGKIDEEHWNKLSDICSVLRCNFESVRQRAVEAAKAERDLVEIRGKTWEYPDEPLENAETRAFEDVSSYLSRLADRVEGNAEAGAAMRKAVDAYKGKVDDKPAPRSLWGSWWRSPVLFYGSAALTGVALWVVEKVMLGF